MNSQKHVFLNSLTLLSISVKMFKLRPSSHDFAVDEQFIFLFSKFNCSDNLRITSFSTDVIINLI